jgi:heme A synthase
MTPNLIHANLANTSLLFAVVAGLWGVVLRLRNRGVDGNYWGILAVGELLFLGQGLLGAYLWISGARPGRLGIHVLYGIVLVIGLPAYYAITKGRDDENTALAYGLLCLFLAAICLRAATTGVG